MSTNNVPNNALFVCFGCLSNVGTLTGLAGLEVVREVGPQNAAIFCLGGLATDVPTVLDKTRAAKRVITVDGCPMNCARKIVEQAGFTPDKIINLVQDCGLQKGPPLQYGDEELQVAVKAIRDAVEAVGWPSSRRATALALVAGGAGISGFTGPRRAPGSRV